MSQGPCFVYACPNCNHPFFNGKPIKEIDFVTRTYSDGKTSDPFMPKFPSITKCKKCEAFIWIDKIAPFTLSWNTGGSINFNSENGTTEEPEWPEAENATSIELEDYFELLKTSWIESKEDELFIRTQIWWAFNDRIREGQPLFKGEDDEKNWNENMRILLALLDPKNTTQKVMMAELYRNMGEFETCIKIINGIKNDKIKLLKVALLKQCELGNRGLF